MTRHAFLALALLAAACSLENTAQEPASEPTSAEAPAGPDAPGGPAARSGWVKPSDEELKELLTPLQYEVTQEDGTERAFRNEYWDNEREGIYVDVVSGEPLFSSRHKYKSGTGWPSFWQPLVPDNVDTGVDHKLGYPRDELRSALGDSHLGHVFNDGPEPTGLRYCINSAALRFIPVEDLEKEGYAEFALGFRD